MRQFNLEQLIGGRWERMNGLPMSEGLANELMKALSITGKLRMVPA